MTVVNGLIIVGFVVWTAAAVWVGVKLGKWLARN
jgi:hypothetical protein